MREHLCLADTPHTPLKGHPVRVRTRVMRMCPETESLCILGHVAGLQRREWVIREQRCDAKLRKLVW